MLQLLEMVDRPETLGFQADMAHTLLYLLGCNAPEDALLPQDFDWRDRPRLTTAYGDLTRALRPCTIDFHVAQNDATVHGAGSHDKTGRHCLPNDPNGKLDIARHAGHWLRDADGQLTQANPPHLLGRLHVSQRRDDAARKRGTASCGDDRGAGRARVDEGNDKLPKPGMPVCRSIDHCDLAGSTFQPPRG